MRDLGASGDQTGSAVTALCLGIAGAALSWRLRMVVGFLALAAGRWLATRS